MYVMMIFGELSLQFSSSIWSNLHSASNYDAVEVADSIHTSCFGADWSDMLTMTFSMVFMLDISIYCISIRSGKLTNYPRAGTLVL